MALELIKTNSNSPDTNFKILALDDIKKIDYSLTETGYIILKELYKHPFLQQKELSIAVHCSPSSLSNHLNRLYQIIPALLYSEQRGRGKFFSLTSTGKAYIYQRESIPFLHAPSPTPHNFSERANTTTASITNEAFRDYLNLLPLISCDSVLPNDVYKIIDNVFEKLYPHVFMKNNFTSIPIYTASLTEEQYYAIYFSLSQLSSYCIAHRLDKSASLIYIKDRLGRSETFIALFYIVEKIDRILFFTQSAP